MLTKSAALFAVLLVVLGMAAFISAKPAYALEIRDYMYVDLSEGPQTYTGADAAMIERFLWTAVEEYGYAYGTVSVDTDNERAYSIDVECDGITDFWFTFTYQDEICVKAEIRYEKTMEGDNWRLWLSNDDRNQYEPMGEDNPYGLKYFCMELDFVFDRSHVSKAVDGFTFDLTSGTATFKGEEAYAVDMFLNNAAFDDYNKKIDIQPDGEVYYYDINLDGKMDFFRSFSDMKDGEFTNIYQKAETCSVTGSMKVDLPDFLVKDYYYGFSGVEEPFYYLSMNFKMSTTSLANAVVKLSKTSFVYKKKVQKPKIVNIDGKALKEGTDYTTKWSNGSSKNVGSYTITITGIGEYSGTTKATYKITKAANPLNVKGKKATVKFKDLKDKKQTLSVSSVIKTKTKGQGKVTYSKVKGNAKISINKTTGKVTVKKGLAKGSYPVTVKVKAKGDKNYKSKTQKVKFTIVVK